MSARLLFSAGTSTRCGLLFFVAGRPTRPLLDLENETVFVGGTRDEILDAPAFHESRADDAGYLEELGRTTPREATLSNY